MRTIVAELAEFERDLIRSSPAWLGQETSNSGARWGQRRADKKAKRVLGMHANGLSYRLIARNVALSKNTVMESGGRAGTRK